MTWLQSLYNNILIGLRFRKYKETNSYSVPNVAARFRMRVAKHEIVESRLSQSLSTLNKLLESELETWKEAHFNAYTAARIAEWKATEQCSMSEAADALTAMATAGRCNMCDLLPVYDRDFTIVNGDNFELPMPH